MDHVGLVKRKQNHRERANIFSKLTFSYTTGLFKRSLNKDLEEDDLYDVVRSCEAKKNGDKFEKEWRNLTKKGKKSLLPVMWKCFGWQYLLLGILNLSWKLINSIYEPEAISKFVSYFNPNSPITFQEAVFYAGLKIGLKVGHALYIQNYIIYVQQLAIRIRTSFCSLVYRKALKLTPTAMNEISLGNVITVITKDVMVFEHNMMLFNDMWIELIRLFVVCYLLYNKMGVTGFVGVAVLLTIVPVQIYVAKLIKDLRLDLCQKTDERLQSTQETLSAMKIIKMYTWERVFSGKVEEKRRKEMRFLMKSLYLRTANFIFGLLTSRVGFYALIMTYIAINKTANAGVIFYAMKVFQDIQHSIMHLIPFGLGRGAELYAAAQRINKVLNGEELDEAETRIYGKPRVTLSHVSVEIRKNPILKDISVELKEGLTIVTGPLGCGKSSLLRLFLKDYPISEGKILSEAEFSYSSQDPWLFPSTIKQNIVFGEPYDQKRYQEVVRVCALQLDFNMFEKGDETIVADRGINLSGGQQARINLARAVYKKSDIYLLDDPLHALDPKVQDYVFQNCIQDFLKNEMCVLVTHNLRHKNAADRMIIMKEGSIIYDGQPTSAQLDIIKEIEMEDNEEHHKEKEDENDTATEESKLLPRRPPGGKKKVYSEVKKTGRVDFAVFKKYFAFGGGFLLFSAISLLFIGSEFTESYSSRLLTNWINLEQEATNIAVNITDTEPSSPRSKDGSRMKWFEQPANNISANTTEQHSPAFLQRVPNFKMDLEHPPINISTNTTGFRPDPVRFLQGVENLKKFTLNETSTNIKSNATGMNSPLFLETKEQSSFTIKMYTAMIVGSLVLDLAKQWLFINFSRKASINLHNAMIEKLTTAKMAFYDNYFIGNILNRFSQDLTKVDEHLPHTINHFIRIALSVGGIVALVSSVNWRFLIPAAVLVTLLAILQRVYQPAARSLKRLESATRSPLIGHLNATMEGVTTIRASRAQGILVEEFDRHQDLYTSAHYMSFCVRRAFGFFMDILSTIFVTLIIGKLLFYNTGETGADVGLAITKASALAMLVQFALMQWTDLENDMTSVERVLEYTEVDQDNYEGEKIPNWPMEGSVLYSNVSLTYKQEKVLKDISFEIKPKQKIGIVGRTGAGKSSIISTLFRLYSYEGSIFIDNINISTIALDYLRNHISIIPQDPLLFQGTIRQNIDPYNSYTDEEIWNTLTKVHMRDHIPSLGLEITDHGSNFSTGQRQLICLARAIIKKNKIVVLDEATANMDPDTEVLAQQAIADNFADCTVFIIAHRLQSVIDCDKIIVMDKGQIVEFENPRILIENKNSFFSQMLATDGSATLSPK